MDTTGEYQPSAFDFVAEQVRLYEETGGREGGTLQGAPVVILTTRGRHTGALRKTPLMRVEHDGRYAVVASMGGAPRHPVWYLNVVADPMVRLQDGDRVMELKAHTATPEERQEWWRRATEVWPAYDDYQRSTEREIPVVVLEPAR